MSDGLRVRPPTSRRNRRPLELRLERKGDFTAFYEIFIEGAYDGLLERIHEGDVVLDAGANVGLFSLLASEKVGPQGLVIAVEPNPANFESLSHHVKVNGCSNVRIYQRAIGDQSGKEVTMAGVGVRAKVVRWESSVLKSGDEYTVKTVTVEELLRQEGVRSDILKMDIEGAERVALGHLGPALQSLRSVAIEVHDLPAKGVVEATFQSFRTAPLPRTGLGAYLRMLGRHPLFLLRLESANHFRSVRRLLRDRGRVGIAEEGFPQNFLYDRAPT